MTRRLAEGSRRLAVPAVLRCVPVAAPIPWPRRGQGILEQAGRRRGCSRAAAGPGSFWGASRPLVCRAAAFLPTEPCASVLRFPPARRRQRAAVRCEGPAGPSGFGRGSPLPRVDLRGGAEGTVGGRVQDVLLIFAKQTSKCLKNDLVVNGIKISN